MGLAARQALGRSSWFGIAYEKNQLSGFQGIKFPWKQTLSGSVEYHGPPRSGRLSFPRLSDFTFTFHFHALEEEMATHSSVLEEKLRSLHGK